MEMNFYGLLKAGAEIEIRPATKENKNYVNSKFWMDSKQHVVATNKCIGRVDWTECKEKENENPETAFNKHVMNMITEHFEVVISA